MNNEPVALTQVEIMNALTLGIPLYTHPVKEQEPDLYSEDGFPLWTSPQFKELTDEEIDELANKYLYVLNDVPYANDIKDFAKAILRKAQEK